MYLVALMLWPCNIFYVLFNIFQELEIQLDKSYSGIIFTSSTHILRHNMGVNKKKNKKLKNKKEKEKVVSLKCTVNLRIPFISINLFSVGHCIIL